MRPGCMAGGHLPVPGVRRRWWICLGRWPVADPATRQTATAAVVPSAATVRAAPLPAIQLRMIILPRQPMCDTRRIPKSATAGPDVRIWEHYLGCLHAGAPFPPDSRRFWPSRRPCRPPRIPAGSADSEGCFGRIFRPAPRRCMARGASPRPACGRPSTPRRSPAPRTARRAPGSWRRARTPISSRWSGTCRS